MQFFTSFYLKFVDIFITRGMYKMVLSGLKNTAVITLGALAIGVAIGMVIAIVKYFADKLFVLCEYLFCPFVPPYKCVDIPI